MKRLTGLSPVVARGRRPGAFGMVLFRDDRSGAHSSQLDFFRGTLAPFLRASERPMAMACFLLLTVPPLPPLPDFNVPRFLRRIALPTVLLAAFPYLGMVVSSRHNINLGAQAFDGTILVGTARETM